MTSSTLTITCTDRHGGSVYGGQTVTVTGHGFRPGYEVAVFDNNRCCIMNKDCSYNSGTCITLSDDEMSWNGESDERKRRAAGGWTSTIDYLSQDEVSILGGTILTLTGESFGMADDANRVFINVATSDEGEVQTLEFEPVSWNDGEIYSV